MVRNDLKSFDFERLEEIRALRRKMKGGGENRQFLNELEKIITLAPSEPENHLHYHNFIPEDNTWEKIDCIAGEVWMQPIGIYETRKRLHEYKYMSEDAMFNEHSSFIVTCKENQYAKVKKWYILPDCRIQKVSKSLCEQSFRNNFGKPIFVISIEAKSSRAH